MSATQTSGAGASRGSIKSYFTGFVLALILTFISFALVMSRVLGHWATLAGIFSAAAVQILVHLHYFLHLDTSSEMQWNLLAALFTLVILFIFIGGSLWIMYDLHWRML